MRVAELRISLPVLQITSLVRHFTPRKPTVFERMLLRLHTALARNETYNSMGLQGIFESILGVPGADLLVQPALESLVALGVFVCRGDVHSLARVTLRDLDLTQDGEKMLRDDMLPAVEVVDLVIHEYDPIRQTVLPSREEGLRRKEALPLALSAGPFKEAYPADLLRKAIPAEGHAWWHASSRIRRIERKTSQVVWKECAAAVTVSDQGVVSLEFPDPAVTGYVAGLELEALLAPALASVFQGSPGEPDGIASADFVRTRPRMAECFAPSDIPKQAAFEPGHVHLAKRIPGFLDLPEEAPSRAAIIVFGSPAGRVQWNSRGDGAIISVTEPFPVEGGIYHRLDGRGLFVRRFTLRAKGKIVEVPLAWSDTQEGVTEPFRAALEGVEIRLDASDSPDETLVPALWRPAEACWKRALALASRSDHSLAISLRDLIRVRTRLLQIRGAKALPAWEKDLEVVIFRRLEVQAQPVTLAVFADVCAALSQAKVGSAPALAGRILEKVSDPASFAELEAIADVLRTVDSRPVPDRLYTTAVRKDLFDRFPEEGFEERLTDRHRIESALRELKKVEGRLQRDTSQENLSTFDFRAPLKTAQVEAALEGCERWSQAWDDLRRDQASFDATVAGTALGRLNDRLREYADFLKKLVSRIPSRFKRIFVVDTNAFIDEPGLLGSFDSKDYVIVSKKVLDELDGLKRNEATRAAATTAIRSLRDHPRENVKYEGADPSLLPPDYGKSADNLILSVALKHRRSDPVLLTSDSNLALKAKAEGLRHLSLGDFLGRRTAS